MFSTWQFVDDQSPATSCRVHLFSLKNIFQHILTLSKWLSIYVYMLAYVCTTTWPRWMKLNCCWEIPRCVSYANTTSLPSLQQGRTLASKNIQNKVCWFLILYVIKMFKANMFSFPTCQTVTYPEALSLRLRGCVFTGKLAVVNKTT